MPGVHGIIEKENVEVKVNVRRERSGSAPSSFFRLPRVIRQTRPAPRVKCRYRYNARRGSERAALIEAYHVSVAGRGPAMVLSQRSAATNVCVGHVLLHATLGPRVAPKSAPARHWFHESVAVRAESVRNARSLPREGQK